MINCAALSKYYLKTLKYPISLILYPSPAFCLWWAVVKFDVNKTHGAAFALGKNITSQNNECSDHQMRHARREGGKQQACKLLSAVCFSQLTTPPAAWAAESLRMRKSAVRYAELTCELQPSYLKARRMWELPGVVWSLRHQQCN